MAKAREIKTRIKAVGNIHRITKTMKMIATVRFQASQRSAVAAKPYTRMIRQLVGELAGAALSDSDGFSHPLLRGPEPAAERCALLVLTSNRGLCGGYNSNVLRSASGYLAKHGADGVQLEVVGNKGAAYFRFAKIEVAEVHRQFGDKPAYADVNLLAQRYMDDFADGKYDRVDVAYMSFESMTRQKPVIQQLLPLQDPSASSAADGDDTDAAPGTLPGAGAGVDYEFSPAPAELLGELLPASVKTHLYQCFIEAVVSEQMARMVAMTAATENAIDMNRDLTRLYNRVRQASITTELTEIIGGAAALQ